MEKKKGRWRKPGPWYLRSVAYSWWRLQVRLQKSECNHGHQIQHYNRYRYIRQLSGTVDRPSLSGFWSKNVSLSISVSPLPCSRPIIRPPRFKRVGRCLFSIPECGKIFFEQLKFTLRKSFCGPPDLVDHKHRNRVPCFFTIRSLLQPWLKMGKFCCINWPIICQTTIDKENWQLRRLQLPNLPWSYTVALNLMERRP